MNTSRLICVGACFLFVTMPDANAQEEKPRQKLPEPTQEALARAEKTVKEVFKADFARKDFAGLRTAATKLYNQALETTDDPAGRFVLYREASELAARAAEFAGALAALDELGREFETDLASLKIKALKAGAANTSATIQKFLAQAALETFADAIAGNDPKVAEELLSLAESAADKAKNDVLAASVKARRLDLVEVLKEFEAFRAAMAVVETKPDDANANTTVGKYLCFIRGDWKRGLAHLEKGSDEKLKALAIAEAPDSKAAMTAMELADGWWDVSETQIAAAKRQCLGRAAYWYGEATSKLTGLSLTKARERTTAIYKQYPGLRDGLADGGSIYSRFAGLWEIRYSNTTVRHYLIDSRGIAYYINLNLSNKQLTVNRSRLIPMGEQMYLAFGNLQRGKDERLMLVGGDLHTQINNRITRESFAGVGKKRPLPEKKGIGADSPDDFSSLEGFWLIKYGNSNQRMLVIGSKGGFIAIDGINAYDGQVVKKEDHFVFNYSSDQRERVKFFQGNLQIEHFSPASTYSDGKPKETGFAVRLSRY